MDIYTGISREGGRGNPVWRQAREKVKHSLFAEHVCFLWTDKMSYDRAFYNVHFTDYMVFNYAAGNPLILFQRINGFMR